MNLQSTNYGNYGKYGYVYLRDNLWFQSEGVLKMGITKCIKNRSTTYITSEIIRGQYLEVFEVPINALRMIDRLLKNYFKSLHVSTTGGGTEFYKREIIGLVEEFLKQTTYYFRKLNEEEISKIEREVYQKPYAKKIVRFIEICYGTYKNKHKPEKFIGATPYDLQQQVLDKASEFFLNNPIGKLVWPCGLGKALMAVFIAKQLDVYPVLFGVPSRMLQSQLRNEILKVYPPETNILFVGGDKDSILNKDVTSTTSIKNIKHILRKIGPTIVISTYASCGLLASDPDIEFCLKVGDEAHHLVGTLNTEKTTGYRLFHKITSRFTLFMTATEKNIYSSGLSPILQSTTTSTTIYNMDDPDVFGKYISEPLTVNWAIEHKKITDYVVLVLKNKEEDVDNLIQTLGIDADNKELFISAYMCLLSLSKYEDLSHMLLYTNSKSSAEKVNEYITMLLKLDTFCHFTDSTNGHSFYNKSIHSNNCKDISSELSIFRQSTRGIISCVFIFGEGFDEPSLNGVCIAENMSSEIRITQYVLRPNRLNRQKPNKKAYIVLPYIDTDDWNERTPYYEKVRNVVYQLRNEDEAIEQKIVLGVPKIYPPRIFENDEMSENMVLLNNGFIVEENEMELRKLKIRLRHSKALSSKESEEKEEYKYERCQNQILGVSSKREYANSRQHREGYIENPDIYFTAKGVWGGWYDYLGVDVKLFIQNKTDWTIECQRLGINTIEKYLKECEHRKDLPKDPGEFYMGFGNIMQELSVGERMGGGRGRR